MKFSKENLPLHASVTNKLSSFSIPFFCCLSQQEVLPSLHSEYIHFFPESIHQINKVGEVLLVWYYSLFSK